MHMTLHSQCETEDSHKCSPKESLVPRVTMDRGSLAHDVCTGPVLIQKIHSAVETCQVPHESPQTRAVNGVLENLDTCSLGRSVAQARCWVCHSDTRRPSKGRTRRKDDGREVFEVFASVEWHERECYEKSRNISDNQRLRVAGMVSGCKTDSESTAPSRIVGSAVRVLSQSEKRKHDRNVRVRLRTNKLSSG